MRLVLLLNFFVLLPLSLHAHVLGEVFEETHLGKPDPRTKIVQKEYKGSHSPTHRYYTVTFTSAYESTSYSVAVSAKSGRITSISETVPSIHEAVLRATFYCEGEVQLPQKAVWPFGFALPNVPGQDQADKRFEFTVSSVSSNQLTLSSRWVNPPTPADSQRPIDVEKRLSELQKIRNDYFEKNGK